MWVNHNMLYVHVFILLFIIYIMPFPKRDLRWVDLLEVVQCTLYIVIRIVETRRTWSLEPAIPSYESWQCQRGALTLTYGLLLSSAV